MNIKSATFTKSFPHFSEMPNSQLPEFAFIGRSNVGKSSLINMITQRKNLAKTSSKPGKTRLINAFDINGTWTLIDLPGYGFAKVSKKKRQGFGDMITKYLEKRRQLMCAFVLIDSRIPPQAIDLEFLEWCVVKEVPIALIFTKCDKLKKTARDIQRETFKATLFERGWEEVPMAIDTSAVKHEGREEILSLISDLLKPAKK